MYYLDNNATTQLAPEVVALLLRLLQENLPLNSSSAHSYGQKAQAILLKARKKIASYCRVTPQEVYFLSSGTEGINLFLRGHFSAFSKDQPCHVLTTNIEHSAVKKTLQSIRETSLPLLIIEELPVGSKGWIEPHLIQAAIRPETKLISIIAANNETGICNPIEEIFLIAKKYQIPLFVDSVNAIGKLPIHFFCMADAFICSGHKIHAPQGSAALIMKKAHKVVSCMTGGGQESNWRSGTPNLAAILGLEQATELLINNEEKYILHMQMLQQAFLEGLRQIAPNLILHGQGPRLCNTLNLSFPHMNGETLLILLDQAGIAASHGSACSSGSREPSQVLQAMGIPLELAKGAIRFSLSRYTTLDQIQYCLQAIQAICNRCSF